MMGRDLNLGMIDVTAKKPEMEEEEKDNELLSLLRKRQQDGVKESAMALIAGGVAEALSGDTGGEIAGYGVDLAQNRLAREEALQDQEHRTLLSELKGKGKKAGDSFKPQLRNVFNPETGKVEYMYFGGPGTQPVPTGQVTGFAPKIFKDEEDRTTVGNLGAGLTGIRTYTPPKPKAESGISPYFKKRSNTLSDKFYSTTKKDRETIKESIIGLNQLKMKGIMPKKAALNSVVKLSEGGRMTDEDRNFVLGAVGKIAQLKEAIKEETSKQVVKRKLEEATALYEHIIKINVAYLQDMAENFASEARSDREKEYLMNKMKKGLLEF